ncbi:MAG: proline iminopeptidase-family hydrolase [Dongiaceae bacterium]
MTDLPTHEGYADFRGHRTWYRVTGTLGRGKRPLVTLHGGPGAASDYLERFGQLAAGGRAVIHYDQLGGGRSTHLPDKGADFWTVELFLAELDNLLRHLGIADYHLLGQSWGGMLGSEHAVRRPAGLRSLTIANSPASMELWVREAARLRQALPAETRDALNRHEAAGTTTDPEYKAAERVFYDHHLCRVTPWPDELVRSFAQMEADPTVYHTMNGPNEFYVVGTLRSWSVIDRLERIDVPTLIISGRHDEATPACVQPYADRIKGARWVIFENSSHLPHIEETEACLKLVGDFLDAQE